MPTIHALHCCLFPSGDLLVDFRSVTADTLATPPSHGATAFIVRSTALLELRAMGDVFIDRKKKNKAKSLAKLLLGQERVPLIDGGFKSVGQLRRSIKTLLKHAAKRGERKTFVIGIDDELFRGAGKGAPPPGPEPPVPPDEPVEVPAWLREDLVGDSPAIDLVRQRIVLASTHDEPVLILGETGTGKEVAARAIHDLAQDGRRGTRPHPFIPVNCSAISRDLFETELFGYKGRAFTGAAAEGSEGLWEAAGSGTLFLDEIGDLPLGQQAKILRAIQDRKIRRVGSTTEIAVDCRVMAATNRDLRSMMQSGDFRADLYYRLVPCVINMPPLREHPQDVRLLAQHFWSEVAKGRPPLSNAVLGALARFRWPGNARELRAVLVRLATTYLKREPRPEHIGAIFHVQGPAGFVEETLDMADEQSIHQSECRRHLWQVEEAVLACKVLLKPFAAENLTDKRVERARRALAQRIADLHLLEGRPTLFHRLATFDAVHQFLQELLKYRRVLEDDAPEAQRVWKRQLAGEVNTTLHAINRERERLLQS